MSELPLIYYEDRTFLDIPEGPMRARVFRWRYYLEQTFGLYNVNERHVCNGNCFIPIRAENSTSIHSPLSRSAPSILQSGSLPESDEKHKYVDTIDQFERIYGCPRSGLIHQCAPTANGRRETCRLLYESETGFSHCRFSNLEVERVSDPYNPYVDDNFSFEEMPTVSKRPERTLRRAREIFDERKRREAERKEVERGRFNNNAMKNTTRALRDMVLRSPTPSPTASPKRSREESDEEGESDRERKCPTPPPMSLFLSSGSSSSSGSISPSPRNKPSSRIIQLADVYTITVENYNRIKRVVEELLFDPLVRDNFDSVPGHSNHSIPMPIAVKNKESEALIAMYTKRLAFLYVLLCHEQERTLGNAAAAATRTAKTPTLSRRRRGKKRAGSPMRLKAGQTALVLLYILSEGLNMNSKNVMVADERLRRAMPVQTDLVWYGIESEYRIGYLRLGTNPASSRVRHKYDRTLAQHIHRLFASGTLDPYITRRILTDDLG